LIYLNHQHAQKDELTVQENLDFSLKISGVFEEDSTVENALNMVGLSAFKSRPFRALSQGQKRRVSLARLAADRSRQLWVLDEPFNTLDQEGISLLEGLVQNHLNAGGVVVLASHLEPKINPRCLKVLMLEK
jgi:heme exporter protein A